MNKQEYLLTCLSEEAAEMIKEATKALRFGLDDTYMDNTPEEKLRQEFNDLVAVIEMFTGWDDIDVWIDRDAIEAKKQKVEKYMKYSIDKGLLK